MKIPSGGRAADARPASLTPGVAAGSNGEQQYRAIFEASSDGLVINDLESGVVLEANPAFCLMHGYDEMTGMHPSTFIHPDCYQLFDEYVQAVRDGREFRCQAQDIRRDGGILDVEVIGRSFVYRGRPAILGVVRDVSEQVRAYQLLEEGVRERTREIERRREVAEGLRDLLAVVNSRRTPDEILDYVVAQSSRLLGSDASAIFLPVEEPAGEVLVIRASSGLEAEYTGVRLPVGMSSTGMAYSRQQPVAVPNVRAALPDEINTHQSLEIEEQAGFVEVLRLPSILDQRGPAGKAVTTGSLRSFASGYGAFLAVPLAAKDKRYGALSLYFREARDFNADEVALASAFADQTALALENARLHAQAEQAAALEERQRLARDLHDAVTQTLFSASLIAEVIPDLWSVDPDEARRHLDKLRRLTTGALAEMRLLLLELRPGALSDLSLSDLLHQLANAATGSTGLEVSVRIDGPVAMRLPADVQVALYRIAQEALNNIIKHAHASQVAVSLRHQVGGAVILEIRDDGRGFDPTARLPGHLGMSIMHERAEAIGAQLQIDSSPDNGTRVAIKWLREERP